MCECIEQPNLWIQWKGKMPVVFNKKKIIPLKGD